MKWHSESGGPWNRMLPSFAETDQLAFLSQNDMPQGEFWFTDNPAKHRQDMNRPQAMTANIYGKRIAATEAFTHMVKHWSEYPAALKPYADAAFIDGANHFIWHTFTCSPPEFGLPGSEYFAGSHLNPNVTWFPQVGPFMDYLGRCQHLLRQGKTVNDVCAYIGDKPYHHWGRWPNWNARSTWRMPKGYNYDILTTEVLLERLTVKDGDLVLPDGMSYRVLAVDLDDESVPPAALKKIAELKKAGASVIFGKRKPQQALGLTNFPRGDEEVRHLAEGLWGNLATLDEALKAKSLLPDFQGPCEYIHRRADDTNIYYVSGRGPVECTFRVSGKQPELWDPVSGKTADATNWKSTQDGRTSVALVLPHNGATFVIFRKPGHPPSNPPTPLQKPEEKTLTGMWAVSFEKDRGAPESAAFDQLTAWNEHSNDGIKHFSGMATYRKKFDLTADEAKRAICLQLGEVKHIAQVRLNGKDLGIVWTDPWSVALTDAVKPGSNELEISVVNTWVNRLIGDAALPKEKRITMTNIALQSGKRTIQDYQGFASEDPLMRSGLLGPVRIEFLP